MFRSMKGVAWSVAASLSLAATASADVMESAPGDAVSAALVAAPAEAPAEVPVVPPENADPVEQEAQPVSPTNSELIQERYPSREIKIEREVVQDASGNYVNHGKWTMYDEKGRMVACGQYRYGERHGVWTRWHSVGGKDMYSQAPYKLFQAPFVSEVTFDNGRLHGKWVVYDKQDRVCSEFLFENGERQGKSVWNYPNGEKMREIDFTGGQMDGQMREWAAPKKLTTNDTYIEGRRLAKKIESYPNGQPKLEATFLFAREVLKCNYDWWNGNVVTTVSKEGKDQRHGLYTSWHKNGQKDEEGQYLNDLPVGKSNWWFENGQKAIEGQYINGERNGLWTWWHENGQKSACGDFVKGVETGKWTWWNEDGKVANSARITEGKSTFSSEENPDVTPSIASAPKAPAPKSVGSRSVTSKAAAAKAPTRQARTPKKAPTPSSTIRR
ncbi:MAG TPA: hypothetical protein VGN12_23855 [Pirellulales bacterium]|jgi:antitoxin component YwqK of YwqJK toxin-antitoxin module